ncbi:hypothetical protein [uncultured Dubosiella sp.]|nr:hypothetical protein [uncultured Dubosiella sp.]
MNEFNAIWEIEERLSTLPRGYISQKRIGGKTHYYLPNATVKPIASAMGI